MRSIHKLGVGEVRVVWSLVLGLGSRLMVRHDLWWRVLGFVLFFQVRMRRRLDLVLPVVCRLVLSCFRVKGLREWGRNDRCLGRRCVQQGSQGRGGRMFRYFGHNSRQDFALCHQPGCNRSCYCIVGWTGTYKCLGCCSPEYKFHQSRISTMIACKPHSRLQACRGRTGGIVGRSYNVG